MSWLIYKHTNKFNGKVYIGQTCQKPEERWLAGHGYPNNKYFDRAIKKYGWYTGFSHEILVENISTLDEANKLEIEYISKYNSYIKSPNSNGYNLTKGGDNRDNFGKIVLQLDDDFNIVNSFVSIGAAGRHIGDSHGTGVSACCRRKTIKCKGYYFCFAEDYNSKWRPKENIHLKPIICLDDKKQYNSIKDFENETGLLVHRYNNELHAGGMRLVYITDYNDDLRSKYLDEKKKKEDSLKIICYETNKEYKNVIEIILDFNFSEKRIPNIYKALKDSGYSVSGYHFVYKSQHTPTWRPRNLKQHRKSIIVCVETGEEFKTLLEASKSKKACASEIGKCCKNIDGKYTSGGYHWCYKENIHLFKIRKSFTGKRVYCFENSKVYPNAEEASKDLQVRSNSIRNCCKKIYNSAGNFHFCYENDIDKNFIINKIIARKVYCVEQNKIYKSTIDAALKNNLSSGSIYNVCKRKSGCHTCGGFHWCFADEMDGFALPRKKKIMCVETGEIFDSCKIAGLSKNTNAAKIGAVCNGKRKSAGDFHWKYME